MPKVQTTSEKSAENGLLGAKRSAFWAHRCLSGVLLARGPAIAGGKPAMSHAHPLCRVWAGLQMPVSPG